LRTLLLEDEVHRADRFRFPKDRNHFTIARGTLRILLSHYLKLEPGQIRFEYNQYGKPSLHPVIGPSDLKFNLSHSGKLALYAFARRREVGIDIEDTRRRIKQAGDIAKRYFSEYENQSFQSLPEDLRREAFFNCWTRKEAYIKAEEKACSFP
jgi:4'-phosphopantetheinyl transferase